MEGSAKEGNHRRGNQINIDLNISITLKGVYVLKVSYELGTW